MKLGFVLPEVGLQKGDVYIGGHVNNVLTVTNQLEKEGHDVHIITTVPRDAAKRPTRAIDWAEVHSIDPRFEYGSPMYGISFIKYSIRQINRLYQNNQLDCVSIHAGFPLLGVISTLSAKWVGCPAIHVQYCPLGGSSGRAAYDLVQSPRIAKLYLGGAAKKVGISTNVSRSLEQMFPHDEVRTIHPAIDTEVYHPQAAHRFDLFESSEPTISYMGSLKPQKGLGTLVDAFQDLRNDLPCQLALALEVRSSRANSPLKKRIDANPNVHAFGAIEDVPAFLAHSDVFVVPFRTTMGPADYPLSAIEAMACGTPLVVTEVGGLPKLVADSGAGVSIGSANPESIKSGILEILRRDGGHSTGAEARKFANERFSSKSITQRYLEIFEDVK